MTNERIYLDYNASTPIAPEVVAAMRPYLETHYGNPSSIHWAGQPARRAVKHARKQTADLLGCEPDEIIFTSGGTESNNLAIKGVMLAKGTQGDHIITSAIEHPAVAEVCRWLSTQGCRVTVLPVNAHARVHPADLEAAIDSNTVLVSIMHANNEVGTLQPISELSEIAHHHGALMHTDAAQSVGKVPVDVDELGVDLLTVAGHKLYAPKGIGALFVRRGVRLAPLLHGARHEGGLRPGTENVPWIVGIGEAAWLASHDLPGQTVHLSALRDRLYEGLVRALGREMVRRNGHPAASLPNTLSVAFRGHRADELLRWTADRIAASAGSACHTGEVQVSPVLRAMGTPEVWAAGTLRLSVGRFTTEEELDLAVAALVTAVREGAAVFP